MVDVDAMQWPDRRRSVPGARYGRRRTDGWDPRTSGALRDLDACDSSRGVKCPGAADRAAVGQPVTST